uniref:Uncharacterized protein LOC111121611 isoform X2 n=1 Tax=Crassostrea virginica TaxID=6565 RepID=A0A8B8CS68_CRAVI|nr:uncharacterized protein LOC111121611 isoform X2 [Crassostrea virginica]
MRDCPINKSDWDVASHELQCVSPNSYHCMLDEKGEPVKQCLGKIWIQEGFCPEYNSNVGRIDVRPCSHDAGCPEQTYWSNEVYRYSTCIKREETNDIYDITTTLSSSSSSPIDDAHLSSTIIAVSVILLTLLILTILMVIIIYRKRRLRQNNQNSERIDQPDTQVQLLPTDIRVNNPNDTRSSKAPSRKGNCASTSEQYKYHRDKLKTKAPSVYVPYSVHDVNKGDHGRDQTQDVEMLKRSGVLIYISSSSKSMQLGGRLRRIDDSGKFGQSTFVASLGQWEPEEDVSLYMFRQPMDEIFSDSNIRQEKMEAMYEMTNQSPKTYFVMHFTTDEWTKHQSTLRKYKLFREANKINL